VRSALGGALSLLAAACATQPYDPFRIPAAELRGRVRTIALAPLEVRASLADRSFAREQIEPLVVARLEQGGFAVVPSAEMERLWRAAAADVGGVFDPVSSEVDPERYEAVEASVYHDLRSQHRVDGVLRLRISTVDLYLTGATTTFCGTTDNVYWPGGRIPRIEEATLVRASCLSATLHDMEERELYGIRSGLETVEAFAWQTRAVRPLEQRLRNPVRIREAVEVIIGPLADRRAER
jgi:hypothetical protein